jgi:hypothetical protein
MTKLNIGAGSVRYLPRGPDFHLDRDSFCSKMGAGAGDGRLRIYVYPSRAIDACCFARAKP